VRACKQRKVEKGVRYSEREREREREREVNTCERALNRRNNVASLSARKKKKENNFLAYSAYS